MKQVNQGIVLFFQIPPQKAKQLNQVCNRLNKKTKVVNPKDYNQPLGYLAGIQGFSKGNKTHAPETVAGEMLLFSGISSELLDQFLSECKASFIPPTPLKAIVTMHNIYWTPEQLYQELKKEHSLMS